MLWTSPADGSSTSSGFAVEHLASFDAAVHSADGARRGDAGDPGGSLMSAEEAMRRLRQLTMRRNIFTTRVTVVIGGSEMTILDAETDAVMERFPLSVVHRPTAVMSGATAGDAYNNVVVLIVLGDPPEVHIFQCLRHRASTTASTGVLVAW